MASLNKSQLIGNLGAAPSIRYMPNGTATATLSLATTEAWTDRESGQKKERTDWHRVVLFAKRAEVARDFLKKGSQVYIEGRMQTRKWTDADGIDRYITEIIASDMQMLGKAPAHETPDAPHDDAPPPDEVPAE